MPEAEFAVVAQIDAATDMAVWGSTLPIVAGTRPFGRKPGRRATCAKSACHLCEVRSSTPTVRGKGAEKVPIDERRVLMSVLPMQAMLVSAVGGSTPEALLPIIFYLGQCEHERVRVGASQGRVVRSFQ